MKKSKKINNLNSENKLLSAKNQKNKYHRSEINVKEPRSLLLI